MRYILFIIAFILFNLMPIKAIEVIKPIPEKLPVNKKKAYLGKLLFHDPILSKDRSLSCFSCHDIYKKCGTDHLSVARGIEGIRENANTLTVLNAVFNFAFFWNGRAKDLREQILFVFRSPLELNISKEELEKRLNSHKLYKKLFKKVYKVDYITEDLIADAIVEFEKTLITPNSKFDLYLKGKVKLSKEEEEGYKLFKEYGCISCHNGINLGGNSLQKFGAVIPYEWKPWFIDRYKLTKKDFGKNVYRVPSLRNVECTYPYFHDGSAKTLEEAVRKMAYHNLGIELENQEVRLIVKFLKTLTGELPKYEK